MTTTNQGKVKVLYHSDGDYVHKDAFTQAVETLKAVRHDVVGFRGNKEILERIDETLKSLGVVG